MIRLLLTSCALLGATSLMAQKPALVKDLSPGGAEPKTLTVYKGELYFFANDHRHGTQIWHTDGVKDPEMVPNTVIDFNPYTEMAVYNGKLYFPGSTITGGTELCCYDGTRSPKVVTDIRPGAPDATPRNFAVAHGKLFFAAQSPAHGAELYSYEETSGVKLYDIYPGVIGSNPSNLKVYKEELYFSPADCGLTGLWRFDNAAGTASQVSGVRIDGQGCAIVAGDRMYFRGSVSGDSAALVSYDGTTVVQHTAALTNGITLLRQTPLGSWGDDVFFGGVTGPASSALCRYSPSANTVARVQPLYFNPAAPGWGVGYEMDGAVEYNNAMYFCLYKDSAVGYELYRYDGSNLTLVADLMPGAKSSYPRELTVFNNSLYMSADDGKTGVELYRLTSSLGLQAATWTGASVSLYPNPAAGTTTLAMTIPSQQALQVSLRDMSGRLVFASGEHSYTAGTHEITLPLQSLAAGTYIYSIADGRNKVLASGSLLKQ